MLFSLWIMKDSPSLSSSCWKQCPKENIMHLYSHSHNILYWTGLGFETLLLSLGFFFPLHTEPTNILFWFSFSVLPVLSIFWEYFATSNLPIYVSWNPSFSYRWHCFLYWSVGAPSPILHLKQQGTKQSIYSVCPENRTSAHQHICSIKKKSLHLVA